MRILVTGASGLLGGRLCELFAGEHEVQAVVRSRSAPPGVREVRLDLADADAVLGALRATAPDVVVHCAALADVEACERNRDLARRENVEATRKVAAAAHGVGARLITISTDLVFDGGRAFSTELDRTAPLMAYGRSKREAEMAASEQAPRAVIFRVALICGRGSGPRRSASEGIADRLRRGESVTLYDDEWRTPIDPESIAEAIHCAIAHPQAAGIFHIAGTERVSRYELGLRTADRLGLDASRILRSTQAAHQGAPRPADVSLDITRARAELGWKPRSLDESLGRGRTD